MYYTIAQMPRLTIITPVYNGERCIESCLKSVIDQKCADVEHLIIDGGSSDRTVAILKEYSQNHRHIRWVSEKDTGQSDAMNKGIGFASGDILGFLNTDDFYEPGVLNRVLKIFKDLPEPSLLVGNCNVWNNQGIMNVNKPQKILLSDLLMGLDIYPNPYNPSAYFYHKSLHQKIGPYNENEHFAMDLDFILSAVKVAHVKYVDETWGNFRFIEGTKTFEDYKSGESQKRAFKILDQHFNALPWFDKTRIGIKRYCVRWLYKRRLLWYFVHQIGFYFNHPIEISRFFVRCWSRTTKFS